MPFLTFMRPVFAHQCPIWVDFGETWIALPSLTEPWPERGVAPTGTTLFLAVASGLEPPAPLFHGSKHAEAPAAPTWRHPMAAVRGYAVWVR